MSADLVRFVEARIAEWETEARDAIRERESVGFVDSNDRAPDYSLQSWPDTGVPAVLVGPELVLRQCEAFRRIVDLYLALEVANLTTENERAQHSSLRWVCREYASIWSDHPDYRQEWAA